MTKSEVDVIVEHANELVTVAGGNDKPRIGTHMGNLGIIADGAVAIRAGLIVAVGKTHQVEEEFAPKHIIDASRKTVMPGFVDPHTHPIFAGSREHELEMKIQGKTYLQILASGGGILKTVRDTRSASESELLESSRINMDLMLKNGTTTVEAKSGYGLTVKDEIKCLNVMRRLGREHQIGLVPTFLGAHAIPLEYSGKTGDYVRLVIEEMIPRVAELKLAEFCDIACESGFFNVEQSREILNSGKKAGLLPRLHADEFAPSGGAEVAAEVDAVSADHLVYSSEEGVRRIRQKGIIAVLLPAASFTLFMKEYAKARQMIDLGIPIALGTDYSPSSRNASQQMTATLACYQLKMTPSECITAMTINAAHALRKAREVGSLEAGKKADLVILDMPNHDFLGYDCGNNLVTDVIKEGRPVVENCRINRMN
ncbi:MAG: imidazolonepropionase [Candidatus Bathyarchaeia archaeon]